ncbi:MAG TPA: galactose ABC transporter substrate-binding protein [Clostridia bacterium]
MKKGMIFFVAIILMAIITTPGCSSLKSTSSAAEKKPVIGVVIGSFDDAWRTTVRNELYKLAEGKAEMNIWNGNSSQQTENEKIDQLISQKVDVLVVNLIEKSAASGIVAKAKSAGIPVIFFNVEPDSNDLQNWDKTYYVGAKADQSGTMQGQILTDYFRKNPPKDGIIDYIILKGEPGHQDTILRTQYSVKTLEDAGFKVNKLAEDTAMWQRDAAQEKMQAFLDSYGSSIDCVIANNDEMALGAIDALKSKGYFSDGKYMPVVGVDSTNTALSAVKDGTLLGTVLNDSASQADAIFKLANVLSDKHTPDKNNFNYPITDNKYVWIEYKKATK